MLTRESIIAALTASLQPDPLIRAAALGGSDATARADERSDIDLFLIVRPGAIEHAASRIDAALLSISPIRLRWRLPMPTWHGFHQAFYQLQHAPEWLMVDWVIIEQGTPHPWFEVERHGTMHALFDKDADVVIRHVDRAAIDAAVNKRLEESRVRFQLFRHLAPKQALRDRPIDAAHFYHSLVLRSLVDVLRCVHCPDRYDYGFRYLHDDLPREMYDAVCRLCYPAGPNAIEECVQEASRLMERLTVDKPSKHFAPEC
ncbi:MAG: hypothetical protein AB7G11_00655 [Phycisphaerales bacterium]